MPSYHIFISLTCLKTNRVFTGMLLLSISRGRLMLKPMVERYHHFDETLLGLPDAARQQYSQCVYLPVLHGSSTLDDVSQS